MGCYVLRRDTLSLSNRGIVTLEVDERGSANVSRSEDYVTYDGCFVFPDFGSSDMSEIYWVS